MDHVPCMFNMSLGRCVCAGGWRGRSEHRGEGEGGRGEGGVKKRKSSCEQALSPHSPSSHDRAED